MISYVIVVLRSGRSCPPGRTPYKPVPGYTRKTGSSGGSATDRKRSRPTCLGRGAKREGHDEVQWDDAGLGLVACAHPLRPPGDMMSFFLPRLLSLAVACFSPAPRLYKYFCRPSRIVTLALSPLLHPLLQTWLFSPLWCVSHPVSHARDPLPTPVADHRHSCMRLVLTSSQPPHSSSPRLRRLLAPTHNVVR